MKWLRMRKPVLLAYLAAARTDRDDAKMLVVEFRRAVTAHLEDCHRATDDLRALLDDERVRAY